MPTPAAYPSRSRFAGVRGEVRRRLFTLAGVASVVAALPAAAMAAGDAKRGGDFAQARCKACHIVDANSGTTPKGNPISFPDFARKHPNDIEQSLKDALFNPHPPLRDMNLNAQTFDDITAYLESLKTAAKPAPASAKDKVRAPRK